MKLNFTFLIGCNQMKKNIYINSLFSNFIKGKKN